MGNSWKVNVPSYTGRTIGNNSWQWDMFGVYPNDTLGAINDYNQFQFDYNTSIFMDDTVRMQRYFTPLLKLLQANIAEWYNRTSLNISNNDSDFVINDKRRNNKVEREDIDGTKEIKKEEVAGVVAKFINEKNVGGYFGEEFTYKDREGNEFKTTLLQRLIGLCHDYLKEDKPLLSKENFETIWDIAGKYSKTGKLTSEEYKTLKNIAANPGGEAEDADEEDEEDNTTKKAERPQKNQAVLDAAKAGEADNYEQLATMMKEALYISGTDTDKLDYVKTKIDKNIVLELTKHFNERYGESEGETIIDAIFNDCSNWGTGNHWWSGDDAKPYVQKLANSLIERTEDLIKNNTNIADEDKDALQNACNALKTSLTSENPSREDIKNAYNDLCTKLDKMEKSIYGED